MEGPLPQGRRSRTRILCAELRTAMPWLSPGLEPMLSREEEAQGSGQVLGRVQGSLWMHGSRQSDKECSLLLRDPALPCLASVL